MPRKLGPSAPALLSLHLSPRIVPRAPSSRAPSSRAPWPPALEPWFVVRGSWFVVRGSCPSGRRPSTASHAPRPPAPGVESRHRFPPRVGRGPRRAPREPGAKGAKALARFQTNIYRSKVNWLVVANMFHVKHPRHFAKSKWPVFL